MADKTLAQLIRETEIAEQRAKEARAQLREAIRAEVPKPTEVQCAQLVNAAEIARRTGLTRPAITNWKTRDMSFPASLTPHLDDSAPIYWWPDVEDWLRDTGRL